LIDLTCHVKTRQKITISSGRYVTEFYTVSEILDDEHTSLLGFVRSGYPHITLESSFRTPVHSLWWCMLLENMETVEGYEILIRDDEKILQGDINIF
jgi:hypothetical protein